MSFSQIAVVTIGYDGKDAFSGTQSVGPYMLPASNGGQLTVNGDCTATNNLKTGAVNKLVVLNNGDELLVITMQQPPGGGGIVIGHNRRISTLPTAPNW